MADTPEDPKTCPDYDTHVMRVFRESLEQARKALRETDHIVRPHQAKLDDPDQPEEPPCPVSTQDK